MAPPLLLLCFLMAAGAGVIGAEQAPEPDPSTEPWASEHQDGARIRSFPEPLQHLVHGPSWHLTGAEASLVTAASGQLRLLQRSLWAAAAALALLLLVLLTSCILLCQLQPRQSQAEGAASGDGIHGSKERGMENGEEHSQRMDNGEEHSQGMDNGEEHPHGMLSLGSSPFPSSFPVELLHAYRSREPLPPCPIHPIRDGASAPEIRISLDSPQPEAFWCPCHQFQQGYCTSEEESHWEEQ